LARHAKVPALLQVAAYADQLAGAGIGVCPDAHLRLGDDRASTHPLAELVPVYRERRRRLQALLDAHLASGTAAVWNDPRYTACGRCDVCAAEVEAHRDLLLVARLRTSQRKKLSTAGIRTIDELAASTGDVPDLAGRTLRTLRAQARLQVRQRPPAPEREAGEVFYDVFAPEALSTMPPPDDGDIFFDFEGDPLWRGGGPAAGTDDWGLEYLFGVLEPDETFRPFWAHDRAAEKRALLDFVDYVERRRRAHPAMHVYHYAAYEKSALLRLAGRHGAGEDTVDSWLRSGLLVDLYATVRSSLRVSQGSYSIKKLEPLYMGDRLRAGAVTTAGDSIVEYQAFRAARESGDTAEAERLLAQIGDYNEYDCLSTLRLRDWLLRRAEENGVAPRRFEPTPAAPATEPTAPPEDPGVRDLTDELMTFAGDDRAVRDDRQQAAAMVAASLGYHRRENKPFWWGHFDRLRTPVDEWGDTRDVLVAHDVSVVTAWSTTGRRRVPRRTLRLVGTLETGSALVACSPAYCVYDPPLPDGLEPPEGAVRAANMRSGTAVVGCTLDDDGHDVLLVEECLPKDVAEYDALPIAICGTAPPFTDSLETALRELGTRVAERLPDLPRQPGLDVLCRRAPHTGGAGLPRVAPGSTDYAGPITQALRLLTDSYLAVQGPPGTGKTHVGAHVIAA
ncbi:MAG: TM0106 family RecB-like putative nuclease, partial [Nocardioidaceae bacterium]